MSVIELLPPMPDLGASKKIPHPNVPGEEMVNIAAIVRVAREVRSPQSIRFYRAFCAAWDGLKVSEGSDISKQTEAMRQALSAVGKRLDFFKIGAGAR